MVSYVRISAALALLMGIQGGPHGVVARARAGVAFQAVALSGQQAPGLPPGVIFGAVNGAPSLDATGKTAFLAILSGPGVTLSNSNSLWSGTPAALTMVARVGSPAPGTTENFLGLQTNPLIGGGSVAI